MLLILLILSICGCATSVIISVLGKTDQSKDSFLTNSHYRLCRTVDSDVPPLADRAAYGGKGASWRPSYFSGDEMELLSLFPHQTKGQHVASHLPQLALIVAVFIWYFVCLISDSKDSHNLLGSWVLICNDFPTVLTPLKRSSSFSKFFLDFLLHSHTHFYYSWRLQAVGKISKCEPSDFFIKFSFLSLFELNPPWKAL